MIFFVRLRQMPDKENRGPRAIHPDVMYNGVNVMHQWVRAGRDLTRDGPADPGQAQRHLQAYPAHAVHTVRSSTVGRPVSHRRDVDYIVRRIGMLRNELARDTVAAGDLGDVLREGGPRGRRVANARRAVRKRAKRARKRTARKRRR